MAPRPMRLHPGRRRRRDRDGSLRMLNGHPFGLGSTRLWGHIALKPAPVDLSLAELLFQPPGDGERYVAARAESRDADPEWIDAQLSGMVDEVEHHIHSVFDCGGEWVLGRTSVVDAAHGSMSARNDRGCPPSVVLGPTKCKNPTTEVDDDGITALIRASVDIVDVSISLEKALVVQRYVRRESDISLIWGDGCGN